MCDVFVKHRHYVPTIIQSYDMIHPAVHQITDIVSRLIYILHIYADHSITLAQPE